MDRESHQMRLSSWYDKKLINFKAIAMKLNEFDRAIRESPSLANGEILNIKPTKIYYLVRGRNAWNSVWVQHYYPGSMATSLEDVEKTAETMRERGNVFYISELPALCFESNQGNLVVTEINTSTPLIGYSANATTNDLTIGQELAENASNNYFSTGANVELAALSFRHDSRFWKRKPPKNDSVIKLFLKKEDTQILEPLTSTLYRRTSQPAGGPKNSLCWSISTSKTEVAYIKALASEFKQ